MDRSEEINIVDKFKFRLLTQVNYALSQKQRQGTETLKYTLIEYPNTKNHSNQQKPIKNSPVSQHIMIIYYITRRTKKNCWQTKVMLHSFRDCSEIDINFLSYRGKYILIKNTKQKN